MAEIKNIALYKMKRGDILSADETIEALGMVAIFNALEEITQEINAVAHCFGDKEMFPTPADVNLRGKQAAKLIGNDKLYNLRELLRLHTANLEGFSRFINSLVTEPDTAKRIKLEKQREKLPSEYYERGWRPVVSHYLEIAGDIAKQQAEQLRNQTNANREGAKHEND